MDVFSISESFTRYCPREDSPSARSNSKHDVLRVGGHRFVKHQTAPHGCDCQSSLMRRATRSIRSAYHIDQHTEGFLLRTASKFASVRAEHFVAPKNPRIIPRAMCGLPPLGKSPVCWTPEILATQALWEKEL